MGKNVFASSFIAAEHHMGKYEPWMDILQHFFVTHGQLKLVVMEI